MNEPTHHRITFDPAALTADQRDGFTCVVCERDLATGGPSVPVGTVPGGLEFLGGQVFACASHLTDDQRDGLACVVCGRDYLTETTPTPHVPVGRVDGGQVFACASHVQDATSGERDYLTETRERAARRATWPGGEPAEVRDLAERHAADTRERATWPGGEPAEAHDLAERHAAISDLSRAIDDLSRVIDELESAQASRDPRRLDQAVTQAGPVVQRAWALITEWERREL